MDKKQRERVLELAKEVSEVTTETPIAGVMHAYGGPAVNLGANNLHLLHEFEPDAEKLEVMNRDCPDYPVAVGAIVDTVYIFTLLTPIQASDWQ